jgi:hypothetical protein
MLYRACQQQGYYLPRSIATASISSSALTTARVVQPRAGQNPIENITATASEVPNNASIARISTSSNTPLRGRVFSPSFAAEGFVIALSDIGRNSFSVIVNDDRENFNAGRFLVKGAAKVTRVPTATGESKAATWG